MHAAAGDPLHDASCAITDKRELSVWAQGFLNQNNCSFACVEGFEVNATGDGCRPKILSTCFRSVSETRTPLSLRNRSGPVRRRLE